MPWKVDQLVGKRVAEADDEGRRWKRGAHLYKVLWVGYAPEDATWEPRQNIEASLIA
jgi:hypothetical protein